MAKATHYVPNRANAVTPYLVVRDGQAALAWYQEVLGATVDSSMEGEGGAVMHAELRFGESQIYMAQEFPDRRRRPASSPRTPWGGRAPRSTCTYRTWTPFTKKPSRRAAARSVLPRTSSGETACRTSWIPSDTAGASRPTSRI